VPKVATRDCGGAEALAERLGSFGREIFDLTISEPNRQIEDGDCRRDHLGGRREAGLGLDGSAARSIFERSISRPRTDNNVALE
jgi:hypothetical protein